jgi:tRNA pseudouridine55 synthase
MTAALCGFVNVLKPPGMTSHDVVQVARRLLGTRRVGHTGTLDPAAAGVLVLAIGPATRLAEFIEGADKSYRAEITLGVTTDTLDAEGQVASRQSAAGVTEAALRDVLGGLTGTIEMRPPAHSAISVGGRRLYELARAGEAVQAPLREVKVHELALMQFTPGEAATALLDVVCSKGTYVRSLAGMIGERLGCGAHLSMLLRTRVGPHTIAQAVTLEELAAAPQEHLVPIAQALAHLPQVRLGPEAVEILRHGQAVPAPEGLSAGRVLVLDEGETVVCLAEVVQERELLLLPRKVFPPLCRP